MSTPTLTPSTSLLSPSPSSSTSKASQATRNPVSSRLYKVLGTNFDDEATREALQTLSDLYGEENHSQPVLETAARARKNLRRDMEVKLADGSRQFLSAFAEVDGKLDELQQHITAMRTRCEEAESQVQSTNEASKVLLERAASLRDERQDVESRRSIVNLFLERFTLSELEIEAMSSRDVPLGKRFFDAMDKTERVRTDCRVLMSGEDGPTKAGLDIMASTSSNLEQGYEKIFRWCSHEFRQLGRELQLEVSDTMREAVRRLRQRPELLRQVHESLQILAQARQTTLSSAFLEALTRGGPSGLPRPIELHAHDPMRYVGDMLAWVHQIIAAEREFFDSLFGVKGDGRMVGSVRLFKGGEEEEWIRDLMDSAVSKLCVPLKVRVQQTLRSQESSIVAYKLANLLQFYLMTMTRTIGEDALLSKTLQEITDVSYKVFYDSIETKGRALLRASLDLDDPDVTAPAVILDHTQVLREIMAVYESSMMGDEDEGERTAGFQKILDVMVDPAVEMCRVSSAEKQRTRPRWDRAVFFLNVLSYLQSIMEPLAFTSGKRTSIQELIEEAAENLTDEHFEHILRDTDLHAAMAAIEAREPNEPLSRAQATEPAQLQGSLHKFSLWLSGLEVVHSPRLARLSVQRLHTRIHRAALERLAEAYKTLCDEVRKPENRYEAGATLLGSERPFGQVGLLRQVCGLDGDM